MAFGMVGSISGLLAVVEPAGSKSVLQHFVTDGGPFPSNADKNPTLTILALAMRSSEYLVDQLKKGNI